MSDGIVTAPVYENYYDELSTVMVRTSDDAAKFDPELYCTQCDELICDVEHGDSMSVLAMTASAHKCEEAEAEEELVPPTDPRSRYDRPSADELYRGES